MEVQSAAALVVSDLAVPVKCYNRWTKPTGKCIEEAPTPSTNACDSALGGSSDQTPEAFAQVSGAACPPPPEPVAGITRDVGAKSMRAKCPSYILQHYHSTGCAGGAFSWRAAMMDPDKLLLLCKDAREYRETTAEHILVSKQDKRHGGGPRVGSFQATIPGTGWEALPKYDFTTRNRSSAFNERMHVEWENHVDHILKNRGKLPTASVVAKAGFRSCAPCCRDMLALARPTGKTFIMVDLAEDDTRGTFHFVAGDKYLPVPKEACNCEQVDALKKIVTDAQENKYATSEAIYDAVTDLGVPIDETAQALYLGDSALFPSCSATHLEGDALLQVLHAEHFARLSAEYGASILRDQDRSASEKTAIHACRARAKQLLIDAWRPNLPNELKSQLETYAEAAVAPLLPEEPDVYLRMKRSKALSVRQQGSSPPPSSMRREARRWGVDGQRGPKTATGPKLQASGLTEDNLKTISEDAVAVSALLGGRSANSLGKEPKVDDSASTAGTSAMASTVAPDDGVDFMGDGENDWSDREDPEDGSSNK